MKNRLSVLIVCILTVGGPPAMGKPSKKAKPAIVTKTELTLPVLQSDLKMDQTQAGPGKDRPVLEFSASSWQPMQFSRPTYQSGLSTFERGPLPHLSVNHISALTDQSHRRGLYLKVGAAGSQLKRSVAQNLSGRKQDAEQTLTLLSLRLGAELRDRKYWAGAVQPLLGFSLLPTVVLGARSQLEDQVNEQGLPTEAQLGLLIHPRAWLGSKWFLDESSLGIMAHAVFGTVGSSDLQGLGAALSFRMNL